MITSIDQFRIFENNNHKFYIYIGHGSDEGVVEFVQGDEFWIFDAEKSCPMGFDILNGLGDKEFPNSMNIEEIRDKLANDFQYCEVISKDEIPTYCKGYEPQPKPVNRLNIRACYPAIKQLTRINDRDWKEFVRDFETQIIRDRLHTLPIDELCKQFYYALQKYSTFMYKDLCDIIDNQFKP